MVRFGADFYVLVCGTWKGSCTTMGQTGKMLIFGVIRSYEKGSQDDW